MHSTPEMLRAFAVIVLLLLNLIFWGGLVLLGGSVKLFTRGAARRRVVLILSWLGEHWAHGNDDIFDLLLPTVWDVRGVDGLDHDGHYLIIANHLSWVDIFAVFRALRGHVSFIRFFLKSELIWFPVLGQACWAMEFPFMKRYSPDDLARHPEKRGRDLETTRQALKHHRSIPMAILNFVEGTRFTREKHADQESPYRHLLRPRIGGIAFVLAAMGAHLDAFLDVTIAYRRRADVGPRHGTRATHHHRRPANRRPVRVLRRRHHRARPRARSLQGLDRRALATEGRAAGCAY